MHSGWTHDTRWKAAVCVLRPDYGCGICANNDYDAIPQCSKLRPIMLLMNSVILNNRALNWLLSTLLLVCHWLAALLSFSQYQQRLATSACLVAGVHEPQTCASAGSGATVLVEYSTPLPGVLVYTIRWIWAAGKDSHYYCCQYW